MNRFLILALSGVSLMGTSVVAMEAEEGSVEASSHTLSPSLTIKHGNLTDVQKWHFQSYCTYKNLRWDPKEIFEVASSPSQGTAIGDTLPEKYSDYTDVQKFHFLSYCLCKNLRNDLLPSPDDNDTDINMQINEKWGKAYHFQTWQPHYYMDTFTYAKTILIPLPPYEEPQSSKKSLSLPEILSEHLKDEKANKKKHEAMKSAFINTLFKPVPCVPTGVMPEVQLQKWKTYIEKRKTEKNLTPKETNDIRLVEKGIANCMRYTQEQKNNSR